jgi:hypothetical protein
MTHACFDGKRHEMREPYVARTAARGEQPFFLIALEAPVPRASLRRSAHESAGIADGDELRVPVNVAPMDRWLDGNTGAQQLAHPETPANPQPETGYSRPLRAV